MKQNLADQISKVFKWLCNRRKLHNITTNTRKQLWYYSLTAYQITQMRPNRVCNFVGLQYRTVLFSNYTESSESSSEPMRGPDAASLHRRRRYHLHLWHKQ